MLSSSTSVVSYKWNIARELFVVVLFAFSAPSAGRQTQIFTMINATWEKLFNLAL